MYLLFNLFPGQRFITFLVIVFIIFAILYKWMQYLGKDPNNILPLNFARRTRWPVLLLLLSIHFQWSPMSFIHNKDVVTFIHQLGTLGIITSITWIVILVLRILKEHILSRYDLTQADNLQARKVQTQYVILENTIIFIVIVIAAGIALMSFSSIRNVGLSVLTSAGIAGIIVGFAAQKALGTILAGIQIALTQPIRFDDVVIIEGEWGKIEEITLTYVVVKIWDKRRLIVPSTYFLENPFENWTQTQADILGTVYLYLDYSIPIDAIREKLTEILNICPFWDGEVNVVQVTDLTDKTVEIRALMSAGNSGDAFDLRAFVRERMIHFIQEKYPDILPKFRISDAPAGI